jgi:2'-5' RNA ligase
MVSTDRARLFLAIPVPLEARAGLTDASAVLQRSMRSEGVRWLDAKALHLTLHFVGGVDRATAVQLCDALASAAPVPAFVTQLTALDAFPVGRRPRVLIAKVEVTPEMVALHSWTAEVLTSLGLAVETRPFHPHVTIARVGRNARIHMSPMELDPIAMPVRELLVMESHLLPEHSVHTELARLPLAA